ncbi:MAG: hypothetical protein ACOVOW_18345 [Spirosomataceae bacterium]
MNVQHSIKLFSAALLMGIVWGCSPSAQVAKTSTNEVYDDLYASASEIRSTNLADRPVIQYNNAYQNSDSDYYSNQSQQQNTATDEYYSQNWVNSRQAYQNNYASNFAGSSYYSPYSSVNSWYNNPSISFGYGYSPWGGYNSYNSFGNFYDPFAWGSSRWSYGSGFNLGWNNFGYNSFYDPWGYNMYSYNPWRQSSFYDPWGRSSYYGYGNTYVYNNYSGAVSGANRRYNWSNVDANKNYRSQSTYNGDYNAANRSPRGGSANTGGRQGASSSQNTNNNTYYSRPQRDGSSSYSRPAQTTTTTTTNSSSNNRAWDWSGGNSNSSNSSQGGRSSGGSSSGSSGGSSGGGGDGGGRSRGSR